MRENKSAELLEAYKTSDIDEFEDKHGYRILQNDTDEFFNSGNYRIPDAYFVDWPYRDKDLGEPFELYEKDGGKFVNDIFGIEQNCYIDTPENREILARALLETPEVHIENWQIEVLPRKAWFDYKESFLLEDNLTLAFKDMSGCVIFDKANVTSPMDEQDNVKFYLVLGNWKRKPSRKGSMAFGSPPRITVVPSICAKEIILIPWLTVPSRKPWPTRSRSLMPVSKKK